MGGRGQGGAANTTVKPQTIRRVTLTAEAQRDLFDLRNHFRRLGRSEARDNLTAAVREAMHRVAAGEGRPAPRPYPEMAAPGDHWLHAGRYWFGYRGEPPAIFGVIYDEADVPHRVRRPRT